MLFTAYFDISTKNKTLANQMIARVYVFLKLLSVIPLVQNPNSLLEDLRRLNQQP